METHSLTDWPALPRMNPNLYHSWLLLWSCMRAWIDQFYRATLNVFIAYFNKFAALTFIGYLYETALVMFIGLQICIEYTHRLLLQICIKNIQWNSLNWPIHPYFTQVTWYLGWILPQKQTALFSLAIKFQIYTADDISLAPSCGHIWHHENRKYRTTWGICIVLHLKQKCPLMPSMFLKNERFLSFLFIPNWIW